MTKIKNTITLKTILLLLLYAAMEVGAQSSSELNPGLVGLFYQDANLTRIGSVWTIDVLDSDAGEWKTSGDFGARWQGYIKAPVTAEIQFYGEANHGLVIEIDGRKIIDTWDDKTMSSGSFQCEKEQLYPVLIKYKQLNRPSLFKVFWSWKGNDKELIPGSALFHKPADYENVLNEYRATLIPNTEGLEFDIASVIDIHNSHDVIEKREALIKTIWGKPGLPENKLPKEVEKEITDSNFVDLINLKQIDKLTIYTDFGLNSIAYHFIPEKANGELAIYHQGHNGEFFYGVKTINAFLERGYAVIALSMPIKGWNSKPIVELERFGKVQITHHEQFRFLKPEDGHPVKYFLEPVTVAVNYARNLNYKNIYMIGISGGGWTTTQYSALDTRIKSSFPVAGSQPVYLRMRAHINSSTMYGDYEQSIPEILEIANYLELYIMASHGENRGQLQVLNEFDECCFKGDGALEYEEIVSDRVRSIGNGRYDLFIDATHSSHQISPKALEIIFEFLHNN